MAINKNFHAYNDKYTYTDIIEKHRTAGDITDNDAELILKYIREKKSKGKIGIRRAQRISVILTGWRRYIKTPYNELTLESMLSGIDAMKEGNSLYGRPYKPNTQNTMIKGLKTFVSWLNKKKIIDIDQGEIDDIKPPEETFDSVSEKDTLNDAQINSMIDASVHARDKAIIAVLAETGARVGEVASITWGDITFTDKNAKIKIIDIKNPAKVKYAYVILRKSYLVEHKKQRASDKDTDFVFRTFDNGRNYVTDQPLTYKGICWTIKRAAAKAEVNLPKGNIGKIFRASSVTNKLRSGVSTVAIMKTHWGAGLNSRMFKHYEKLVDTDTENMLLQASGVDEIPKYERTEASTSVRCACGELCAPGAKFCPQCASPLTKAAIADMHVVVQDAKASPEYKDLLSRLEVMQQQILELHAKSAV